MWFYYIIIGTLVMLILTPFALHGIIQLLTIENFGLKKCIALATAFNIISLVVVLWTDKLTYFPLIAVVFGLFIILINPREWKKFLLAWLGYIVLLVIVVSIFVYGARNVFTFKL